MADPWTPGPWKWQGEDYRGGWGWQMLVGPSGEGLIVGQDLDGGICKHLCAHVPVDPALCVTGLDANGKEHVEPVHVFSEANARLIAAAPEMAQAVERMAGFLEAASTLDFNEDCNVMWASVVAAEARALLARIRSGGTEK